MIIKNMAHAATYDLQVTQVAIILGGFDYVGNVGASTPHNHMGLHGLLEG
jgi:hypothetical protein